MTHGVIGLEPDVGTGVDSGRPCLTGGIDHVELVAAEFWIVHIGDLWNGTRSKEGQAQRSGRADWSVAIMICCDANVLPVGGSTAHNFKTHNSRFLIVDKGRLCH